MLETNDMVMMKTAMNLDFRHKLLLSARLCERSFCDNLGGRHSLSLKVSEFIALSETTFTKELASEVFLDAYVSIELYDFLFNDNLGIILLVLRRLSSLLWLLHCFSLVFTSLL